ncbi:ty3-gypsy retrotransposon protein [Cucumis melo var. makuwa]|uniref:Ty3-gypsy retrotransposon protein n=1 Tax=Cucumis melo var. makuwa TaxID=1194695 RepID=A0A5A7SQT8_CUCMM|nr:ty3-gypsy retrotransposon protein [Cucumis melo var. makuwa]TYK04479.1 ty3-gypsy retrotransposon protein [Cucumis melo var. makuwa]
MHPNLLLQATFTWNLSLAIVQNGSSKSKIKVLSSHSILKQLMESPKGGIIIGENPLFEKSTPASNPSEQESHLEVVSVMMVDVIAKVAMTEMEMKINFLMKAVEERDREIAALKDQMKAWEMVESSKTLIVKASVRKSCVAGKLDAIVHLCRFSISLRPRQLITLMKFLPRNFLDNHLKEVLEATTCYAVNIVEVDNNYAYSE